MSDAVVASAETLEGSSADRLSERRQRRRDELIGSIAAFIRIEGPDVSMDQIAAACGVTKPIIYRHFGDRDGMVRALSARHAGIMASLAAAADAEPEPGTASAVLRRQIDNYLATIEQDTNLYRFLSANKPAGPEGEHLLDAVAEQVRRIVAGFLDAEGKSTAPATTIAYALTGMVHQVGQWWLLDRTLTREQLVDQLVAIAWAGLGSDDIAEPVAPATAARRNDN